jgi:asparagine synthase (glutamine-hydrolysing)
MCGIVGYLSSRAAIDAPTLSRMRDTLTHRGPDGQGQWISGDGDVGLGHRRLAIVDLTEGGHQPMFSPDERYVVSYNGEIYNHFELREELQAKGWMFRSTSDTEVLLAAWQQWGEAALDRFAGMFAFAIWDRQARRLFAARDRAGEKPFFYRHADRTFAFASELKALFAHPAMPRRADAYAFDHFLAYGYVPREQCLVAGYAKLPAGHKLRYDLDDDRLEVEPYWTLPKYDRKTPCSFDELVEQFEPLLETSVRRQMLADVPVGILLSGGLDSSLVAETASRVASNVTTFTIGFPGHEGFDESPIAKRLSEELGTEHIELMAEPDTIDLLPRLAAQYDEPIADSSMIPTHLVSRLVRTRATVALGGDGGDELFGGYPQYSWVWRIAGARRAGLHRLRLDRLAARSLPYKLAGRKMALRLLDPADAAVTVSRVAEPGQRQALMPLAHRPPYRAAEQFRTSLVSRWKDPSERTMALDFLTYMCDDILVKVDRASMLTSLEVRAPLLDPAIIEFAFGQLAPEQRATAGARKLLLRHVARKRLPAWFDSQRKQGFSIPLAAWLKGPWASLLEDLAESSGDGLLDPAEVRKFLRAGATADRLAHQIFQLAMLELWRRHYNVSWG